MTNQRDVFKRVIDRVRSHIRQNEASYSIAGPRFSHRRSSGLVDILFDNKYLSFYVTFSEENVMVVLNSIKRLVSVDMKDRKLDEVVGLLADAICQQSDDFENKSRNS